MDKENVLGLFRFIQLGENDISELPIEVTQDKIHTTYRFAKFPQALPSGEYLFVPINSYKTLDELQQSALNLVNFSIDSDDRSIEYILENAFLLCGTMPTDNEAGMVGMAIL